MGDLERHLLADQPLEQHAEIAEHLAEVEHLRPQRLLARERQKLPHQSGGAVGVLLDLHDVLEGRIGRLVRVQQEVGRHHDGGEHVVEIVGDAAGELADQFHLLLLVDAVLQRALRRGLERVDDRRLAIAVAILDAEHEEIGPALALPGERGFDRRDLALAFGRLTDGGFERGAVALGDHGEDRAVVALERAFEGRRKARIAACDAPMPVDGGDGHRRVLEEAHEAHFRGALRVAAVVLGAVEHQGARGARRAVGAEGDLVEQPHRHRFAAARAQIEVEHFRLHLARRGGERGEELGALAGDDVVELERAGADLREVVVEPCGERGVEIDDVARGIDREEAGRRVVEIVDGVLQLLEDVLLPLALARDVGDRPDRHALVALALAERAHAQPQPARRLRRGAGQAHLLLQAAAFARRLQQPVDRLGNVRIADEHPLDRPHVVVVGGAGQVEIGGIGVEDAAGMVGDEGALGGIVDHRLEQRMAAVAPGQAQDAGGHGEQRKDADGAEHGQEHDNIGLGVVAADIDEAGGGADQKQRHQQHQADGAAARHVLALVEGGPLRAFAAFGVALPCPVLACHDASCDLLSPRRELPTLSASPGPRGARASPPPPSG